MNCIIFSHSTVIFCSQVRWRPVVGGLTLQFYFAVIILKWDVGYKVFQFLGHEVQSFLSYTDYGSEFVFGKKYVDHIFAMKVIRTPEIT